MSATTCRHRGRSRGMGIGRSIESQVRASSMRQRMQRSFGVVGAPVVSSEAVPPLSRRQGQGHGGGHGFPSKVQLVGQATRKRLEAAEVKILRVQSLVQKCATVETQVCCCCVRACVRVCVLSPSVSATVRAEVCTNDNATNSLGGRFRGWLRCLQRKKLHDSASKMRAALEKQREKATKAQQTPPRQPQKHSTTPAKPQRNDPATNTPVAGADSTPDVTSRRERSGGGAQTSPPSAPTAGGRSSGADADCSPERAADLLERFRPSPTSVVTMAGRKAAGVLLAQASHPRMLSFLTGSGNIKVLVRVYVAELVVFYARMFVRGGGMRAESQRRQHCVNGAVLADRAVLILFGWIRSGLVLRRFCCVPGAYRPRKAFAHATGTI